MKKHIYPVLCAVLLVIALSACNLQIPTVTQTPPSALEEPETTAVPTPVPTAEPTAAPTEEPTPEPTPAPEEESDVQTSALEEENTDQFMLPAPEIGNDAFVQEFMNNPIDMTYMEEMENAASVSAMIYACNTAAESWKDQIDAVYMHIIEIGDADTVSRIKEEQNAWQDAQDAQLQYIRDGADAEGTVAVMNVSENIMLYYRSRAIDLCAVLYELEGQLTFG